MFLREYTAYVNNYNNAISTLAWCMQNPLFANFIQVRTAAGCLPGCGCPQCYATLKDAVLVLIPLCSLVSGSRA